MTTGEQLKLEGITAVLAAATAPHRPWRWHAELALNTLIAKGDPFTIEDLRKLVPTDITPHHHNAWGALISTAAQAGHIQRCGIAKTHRKRAHAREVKLWQATST